jgi:hypothetical protein
LVQDLTIHTLYHSAKFQNLKVVAMEEKGSPRKQVYIFAGLHDHPKLG